MIEIIKYIFSKLFYYSFTGDFRPQLNFFDIIPWAVILLALFGLYFVAKNIATLENKKWLFFQFVLGMFFWFFYMFSSYVIIIGYERAVFFTSILVALISGFGIEEIKKYLSLKSKNLGLILKFAEIFALFFFIILIPFYTQRENWSKLILSNPITQADSIPMAPANNYLTNEDLRIFKSIKEIIFLSVPWKGTVIGVASNNYPIETKGGTITMNSGIYNNFLNSDCLGKKQIAKEKNIDYIYSPQFLCDNFQEDDKSSEGFILYKFND